MKKILYKEWKLVVMPVVYVFMSFALMLLIPNYPYSVVAFYTCLGIFLSVQTARENKDVLYMIMLPISKRDIVKARYSLIISIETIQILLSIPVAIIKAKGGLGENQAGMEANIAFFGACFLIYAVFNMFFLGGYFKNVYNVGTSFIKASIAVFFVIICIEASVHITKAVNGSCFWDSIRPEDLMRQIPLLLAGIVIAALLTAVRYRIDTAHFEKQDI